MPSMSMKDPEAPEAPPAEQSLGNGVGKSAVAKLHEFKEQLLLLSTLVATVTYVAGLNLPGGSWGQDDPAGHMAGDPILRDTHYHRYLAFYYCNATALAASLVVSLILIIQQKKERVWTVVLRVVVVLDLLSLMGAYGSGSCRDAFTTIYAAVIFFLLLLVIISVFLYLCRNHSSSDSNSKSNSKSISNSNHDSDCNLNPGSESNSIPNSNSNPDSNFIPKSDSFAGVVMQLQTQKNAVRSLDLNAKKQEKEQSDVLMLLATFAVTITYVAGLSPPGGFWSSTQDGHNLSDPVLQARGRYRAFFICNTTSFAVSLLIIVLLLEKKLLKKKKLVRFLVRTEALYGLIAIALLCLMAAYAAGSCREADNTIFVLTLAAAVPVCVGLQVAVFSCWKQLGTICHRVLTWFKAKFNTPRGTSVSKDIELHIQNTRYLVMLLATLVVTITYQAGLDPPGGLWLDTRDGHIIGHPVLQTTHPTRYKIFFYSNSAAFVTSLVVIMMLQSKYLLTRHTLEATLVLDLFGLITAYGAGSTRDVNASFYIIALAGIVLVYVIVHITIIDHAPEPGGVDVAVMVLDDKRKVLLLVAILAATLTYQAGLTPPGGFWLADDQGLGRRAGFPVLLDNYPRRYHAFSYSNAASFMASVTLILLLVNPKLYRPGIRCYALYVCMLVGMFGLMGAYAAGSSRLLKTSIYVLSLVVAVLVVITVLVTLFRVFRRWKAKPGQGNGNAKVSGNGNANNNNKENDNDSKNIVAAATPTNSSKNNVTSTVATADDDDDDNDENNNNNNEEKDRLEYLMLLGILGASMTYQTGLKPPGGLWQDNTDGHSAGNPILHDINKHRYNAFFYSNSTSFMASIVVVVMLLPLTIRKYRVRNLPLWPMHTAILLDMISLLVAYAAGSTRKWATSRNVMLLIIPVFLYIAVYVTASIFYRKEGPPVAEPPTPTPTPSAPNVDAE